MATRPARPWLRTPVRDSPAPRSLPSNKPPLTGYSNTGPAPSPVLASPNRSGGRSEIRASRACGRLTSRPATVEPATAYSSSVRPVQLLNHSLHTSRCLLIHLPDANEYGRYQQVHEGQTGPGREPWNLYRMSDRVDHQPRNQRRQIPRPHTRQHLKLAL